jgi:hypothetical protein
VAGVPPIIPLPDQTVGGNGFNIFWLINAGAWAKLTRQLLCILMRFLLAQEFAEGPERTGNRRLAAQK